MKIAMILASVLLIGAVAAPSVEADCKKKQQSSGNGSARAGKVLRVTFSQSGGFAGVNNKAELELNSMPQADAQNLMKLLRDSGILRVTTLAEKNPHAADVFYYDIVVAEKNKTHHVTFDDTTLPQAYRPLVDYLRAKASPVPR